MIRENPGTSGSVLSGRVKRSFHSVILEGDFVVLDIPGGSHSKSDRFKEWKGSNAGFGKDAVDAAGKRLLFDSSP
ncbi:MAG: hypothetical protein WA663_02280 [Candidatus Acidiferrales bacterium]